MFRLGELRELIENPLHVLGCDSFTLIDDIDRDATISDGVPLHLDRLAAAELDRIGQKVEQDLSHPPSIGRDRDRWPARLQPELGIVLGSQRRDSDEQILDQSGELNRLNCQLEFPRFNLRKIQHVVDQLQKVCCRLECRSTPCRCFGFSGP